MQNASIQEYTKELSFLLQDSVKLRGKKQNISELDV